MTTEKTNRREFEEWALDKGYSMQRSKYENTSYMSIATDNSWQAWQVARERHTPISDEAIESACDVLDDNIQSCDSGESDQEKMLQEARDYLWSMHFSNNPPTNQNEL